MSPIEGPMPLTPEWHALRMTTIGASRAAQACNMSDYGTSLHLYREMTGEAEPFRGNKFTKRGTRYEPLVVEDYAELTGTSFLRYPCPMFHHPLYQFATATPDVWVDDKSGWDIKTMNPRLVKKKLGERLSDDVPNDWVFQGTQQCAIMGWEFVLFVVKFDIDEDPIPFQINRNDDLFALMVSAEEELIQRVRDRCPPEPNWQHHSTPALIRELHRSCNDVRIELSPDAAAAWEAQEKIAERIKKDEEERERYRAFVVHEIAENFAGVLPDGRMVRRKMIAKAPHTVTPKPYWDVRAVKFDGGPIQNLTAEDVAMTLPPSSTELYDAAEAVLVRCGYRLREESEHGSRYYSAIGKPDVRVSNHDPNSKTMNWMERNGVISVRTDAKWFAERLEELESELSEKVTV